MTIQKYPPPPPLATLRGQTRSYRAYHATQTPLFSNLLMLPLDTEVCHESQICLRFHRILNVILEMAFSAHCTSIWKLNPIPRSVISKVVQKCIWCCGQVQRCVMASRWARRWGKLCSGAWKRGQYSHAAVFSPWCCMIDSITGCIWS